MVSPIWRTGGPRFDTSAAGSTSNTVQSVAGPLTLGGRWVEGGGPDYERMFNACLEGLSADTMVVRVLYHS
ncbi:hypothetical protein ACH4VX_11785 [Streptomyces sp. NPDC020731]|uniref:hypothetical protein n=1 Tax=Streptomyces sp. NPDC020731 TaxID=3365085 RepID=UPI0037B5AD10